MGDTIAAIATSPGESGIGIVKISGDKASDILTRIFLRKKGDLKKDDIIDRHLYYGFVVDGDHIIDEVLAVLLRAPHTYTGEDVVEINCHGSMISLRKTLMLVLQQGARPAEPGEFSKLAFLNGRMDLSQAEAVIDLIQAKTDMGYGSAVDQLEGKFSSEIVSFREAAMEILANVTVNIDYPDTDAPELAIAELRKKMSTLMDDISELLSTFEVGRIVKYGFKVAINGKPNVGKSSLLNNLMRESRAIVTEIPGTTRDAIEEEINIGGVPVRIIDTAGIRETDDEVESLGIEKSKNAFDRADLVLVVLDGSSELTAEDRDILKKSESRPSIICVNKTDLGSKISEEDDLYKDADRRIIKMSMKTKEGLTELEQEIEDMVYGGKIIGRDGLLVTNERHARLLESAVHEFQNGIDAIDKGEALDFVEMNLRGAIEHLGAITGEVSNEDILDEVFSRFCIGK